MLCFHNRSSQISSAGPTRHYKQRTPAALSDGNIRCYICFPDHYTTMGSAFIGKISLKHACSGIIPTKPVLPICHRNRIPGLYPFVQPRKDQEPGKEQRLPFRRDPFLLHGCPFPALPGIMRRTRVSFSNAKLSNYE